MPNVSKVPRMIGYKQSTMENETECIFDIFVGREQMMMKK